MKTKNIKVNLDGSFNELKLRMGQNMLQIAEQVGCNYQILTRAMKRGTATTSVLMRVCNAYEIELSQFISWGECEDDKFSRRYKEEVKSLIDERKKEDENHLKRKNEIDKKLLTIL